MKLCEIFDPEVALRDLEHKPTLDKIEDLRAATSHELRKNAKILDNLLKNSDYVSDTHMGGLAMSYINIPMYHYGKKNIMHKSLYVAPDAPERISKLVARLVNRNHELMKLLVNLADREKKTKKSYAAQAVSSVKDIPYDHSNPPPTRIKNGPRSSIYNPYYFEGEEHYAGEWNGFIFQHKTFNAQLEQMQAALLRNGLPGFSALYASTTMRRQGGNWSAVQNAVAVGAGGRFVWQRAGGGFGKNVVWIWNSSGKINFNTSTFLEATHEKQDEWLNETRD